MPSKKCIHNRQILFCQECGGSGLCIHKRRKYDCIICGGSNTCIHKKIKGTCKECKGKFICKHNKRISVCKQCGGKSLCEHNITKDCCIYCNGSQICEHNTVKSKCRNCSGASICIHNKERHHCVICSPQNACQNCKYTLVKKSYRFHPYCFSCFCVLNPNVDIPKRYKIKENYLRDRLKDEYKETITITFDKKVEDGCSKRRPDVRIDFGTHNIIVECDENEHRGYSCENKRTMEIFQDCGNRPIVLLRFNPDSYEENYIKHNGCFKINKSGLKIDEKEFERRVKILIERIDFYMKNTPKKEVTIENFFYSDVLYINLV